MSAWYSATVGSRPRRDAMAATSAELAAIASRLGRLPSVAEYHADMGVINKDASKVYRYMNFDQIEEYAEVAKEVAV